METVPTKIQEQALQWLLRLEEDESTQCRKAFLEWCEQSRDHVQAFLEVTVLDRQLNEIDLPEAVDIEALIEDCRKSSAAAAVANILPLEPRPQMHTSRSPAPRRRLGWAMAASLAVGLVGYASFTLISGNSDYRTQIGEQRSVKLTDGSVIHLNTRSQVKVHYSDEGRDIDLLEGEAFFVVARDPDRPFRVLVGDATVQALGTQFNVYRQDARTTVSVVEGKVQVATDAIPVPLVQGETAQLLKDRSVVKNETAEIAQATAWRQRQLDFRRATLFEVAREFNRYSTTRIRIADSQIGERRLNGVFDADMPEQLLKFLEQRQDLRFERTGNTVVIHARTE